MNSFASSMFFENFQTLMPRMGGAEWAPAGPAGLLWWLMSSAIGCLLASAALYVPGNETQNHGTPFHPDFVRIISAAKEYQPPPCLPTFSTTSSMLTSRFS